MPRVILRCYEELNDYLPREKQKRDFEVCLGGDRRLRRVLEEQGVPCGDVDLILVNGRSFDFEGELQDGDRVSIYPVFERFDIAMVTNLKGRPLRVLKFVAESHLARVAERMKALGFDVKCTPELRTKEAVEISKKEGRVLLTTCEEVLSEDAVSRGLYVRPGGVEEQTLRIIEALNL